MLFFCLALNYVKEVRWWMNSNACKLSVGKLYCSFCSIKQVRKINGLIFHLFGYSVKIKAKKHKILHLPFSISLLKLRRTIYIFDYVRRMKGRESLADSRIKNSKVPGLKKILLHPHRILPFSSSCVRWEENFIYLISLTSKSFFKHSSSNILKDEHEAIGVESIT